MNETKPMPPSNKSIRSTKDGYERAKKNVENLINSFNRETDRACVIIAAACADDLLSKVLTKFLLPNTASQDELLDPDKALGTFSARINVVFRLGLIDSNFTRALNLLRKMRNSFAHDASTANLEQASHRDRVREIIMPLARYQGFEGIKSLVNKGKTDTAADFCTGSSVIIGRLESLLVDVDTIREIPPYPFIPPVWKKKLTSEK